MDVDPPGVARAGVGRLRVKHYRFIDYATQLYLVVVALLILCFHGPRVEGWAWLVAAHAACLLVIHALIQAQAAGWGGRGVEFLRGFYPILLYTGFYRETGSLNQMFCSGYLDAVFIRMDAQVFGFQPSLVFMERFPQRLVAEFLYAAYFSYYSMIAGIGLVLFIRNRAQFFHYVSIVSFVFYCCYLIYIFLPVMGPRIFFGQGADLIFGSSGRFEFPSELLLQPPPDFPESVQAGLFYRVVIFIYQHFEAPGAAFPSSHVAVALTTVYFSWIYLKRIRLIHGFIALALCVATVYCRYHYVVDVAAGAAVAALLLPVGNSLFRRFGGGEDEHGASGGRRT